MKEGDRESRNLCRDNITDTNGVAGARTVRGNEQIDRSDSPIVKLLLPPVATSLEIAEGLDRGDEPRVAQAWGGTPKSASPVARTGRSRRSRWTCNMTATPPISR